LGSGSLRAAVNAANATAANDVIRFDPGIGGTIALTSGELAITNPVRIVGPGPSEITVSGTDESRIFRVRSGVVATIALLTISDGFVGGTDSQDAGVEGTDGAPGDDGDPAAAAASSGSNAFGGAIFNAGRLTLAGVVVSDSSAVGGAGGEATATGGAGGTGAGGTLGGTGGSGGAATATGGTGGAAAGGGVFNRGTLRLLHSTVTDNAAVGGDGGDATAVGGAGGAGGAGTVTGGNGGNGGTATGTGGDGGIGVGGGVVNVGGRLTVTNSTVSGNLGAGGPGGDGDATGGQGGAAGDGLVLDGSPGAPGGSNSAVGDRGVGAGGGVVNDNTGAGTTLVDTTIAFNEAETGANLAGFRITARSTIVSDPLGGGENCAGAPASNGYNIDSGTSCNFDAATDQEATDPELGPLADNGGPTPTHLPAPTSPAIDQGAPAGPTIDQRGLPRPVNFPDIPNAPGGDGSDVGAVEVQDEDLKR
jgi:hypothetical protein